MDPTEVLDAKERRWHERRRLAARYKSTVVTITVCLPLSYRTGKAFDTLFFVMADKVCAFLEGKNIPVRRKKILRSADGYTAYFVVSGEAAWVKRACVEAENGLVFGRVLDIDVMDENEVQIGREELRMPPRNCFVCGMPAASCVSRRSHTAGEVADGIRLLMRKIASDAEFEKFRGILQEERGRPDQGGENAPGG